MNERRFLEKDIIPRDVSNYAPVRLAAERMPDMCRKGPPEFPFLRE